MQDESKVNVIYPGSCILDPESEIVVLVTGGFHTPGLTKLLKDRNISYMVITPNVTKGTYFAESVYTNLLVDLQADTLSSSIRLPLELAKGDMVKVNELADIILTSTYKLERQGVPFKDIIQNLNPLVLLSKEEGKYRLESKSGKLEILYELDPETGIITDKKTGKPITAPGQTKTGKTPFMGEGVYELFREKHQILKILSDFPLTGWLVEPLVFAWAARSWYTLGLEQAELTKMAVLFAKFTQGIFLEGEDEATVRQEYKQMMETFLNKHFSRDGPTDAESQSFVFNLETNLFNVFTPLFMAQLAKIPEIQPLTQAAIYAAEFADPVQDALLSAYKKYNSFISSFLYRLTRGRMGKKPFMSNSRFSFFNNQVSVNNAREIVWAFKTSKVKVRKTGKSGNILEITSKISNGESGYSLVFDEDIPLNLSEFNAFTFSVRRKPQTDRGPPDSFYFLTKSKSGIKRGGRLFTRGFGYIHNITKKWQEVVLPFSKVFPSPESANDITAVTLNFLDRGDHRQSSDKVVYQIKNFQAVQLEEEDKKELSEDNQILNKYRSGELKGDLANQLDEVTKKQVNVFNKNVPSISEVRQDLKTPLTYMHHEANFTTIADSKKKFAIKFVHKPLFENNELPYYGFSSNEPQIEEEIFSPKYEYGFGKEGLQWHLLKAIEAIEVFGTDAIGYRVCVTKDIFNQLVQQDEDLYNRYSRTGILEVIDEPLVVSISSLPENYPLPQGVSSHNADEQILLSTFIIVPFIETFKDRIIAIAEDPNITSGDKIVRINDLQDKFFDKRQELWQKGIYIPGFRFGDTGIQNKQIKVLDTSNYRPIDLKSGLPDNNDPQYVLTIEDDFSHIGRSSFLKELELKHRIDGLHSHYVAKDKETSLVVFRENWNSGSYSSIESAQRAVISKHVSTGENPYSLAKNELSLLSRIALLEEASEGENSEIALQALEDLWRWLCHVDDEKAWNTFLRWKKIVENQGKAIFDLLDRYDAWGLYELLMEQGSYNDAAAFLLDYIANGKDLDTQFTNIFSHAIARAYLSSGDYEKALNMNTNLSSDIEKIINKSDLLGMDYVPIKSSGDMKQFCNQRDVPVVVFVNPNIQFYDHLTERMDKGDLRPVIRKQKKEFFYKWLALVNKYFDFLSNGQFSLKLNEVYFERPAEDEEFEPFSALSAMNSPDVKPYLGNSFVLLVGYEGLPIEDYLGQGVISIHPPQLVEFSDSRITIPLPHIDQDTMFGLGNDRVNLNKKEGVSAVGYRTTPAQLPTIAFMRQILHGLSVRPTRLRTDVKLFEKYTFYDELDRHSYGLESSIDAGLLTLYEGNRIRVGWPEVPILIQADNNNLFQPFPVIPLENTEIEIDNERIKEFKDLFYKIAFLLFQGPDSSEKAAKELSVLEHKVRHLFYGDENIRSEHCGELVELYFISNNIDIRGNNDRLLFSIHSNKKNDEIRISAPENPYYPGDALRKLFNRISKGKNEIIIKKNDLNQAGKIPFMGEGAYELFREKHQILKILSDFPLTGWLVEPLVFAWVARSWYTLGLEQAELTKMAVLFAKFTQGIFLEGEDEATVRQEYKQMMETFLNKHFSRDGPTDAESQSFVFNLETNLFNVFTPLFMAQLAKILETQPLTQAAIDAAAFAAPVQDALLSAHKKYNSFISSFLYRLTRGHSRFGKMPFMAEQGDYIPDNSLSENKAGSILGIRNIRAKTFFFFALSIPLITGFFAIASYLPNYIINIASILKLEQIADIFVNIFGTNISGNSILDIFVKNYRNDFVIIPGITSLFYALTHIIKYDKKSKHYLITIGSFKGFIITLLAVPLLVYHLVALYPYPYMLNIVISVLATYGVINRLRIVYSRETNNSLHKLKNVMIRSLYAIISFEIIAHLQNEVFEGKFGWSGKSDIMDIIMIICSSIISLFVIKKLIKATDYSQNILEKDYDISGISSQRLKDNPFMGEGAYELFREKHQILKILSDFPLTGWLVEPLVFAWVARSWYTLGLEQAELTKMAVLFAKFTQGIFLEGEDEATVRQEYKQMMETFLNKHFSRDGPTDAESQSFVFNLETNLFNVFTPLFMAQLAKILETQPLTQAAIDAAAFAAPVQDALLSAHKKYNSFISSFLYRLTRGHSRFGKKPFMADNQPEIDRDYMIILQMLDQVRDVIRKAADTTTISNYTCTLWNTVGNTKRLGMTDEQIVQCYLRQTPVVQIANSPLLSPVEVDEFLTFSERIARYYVANWENEKWRRIDFFLSEISIDSSFVDQILWRFSENGFPYPELYNYCIPAGSNRISKEHSIAFNNPDGKYASIDLEIIDCSNFNIKLNINEPDKQSESKETKIRLQGDVYSTSLYLSVFEAVFDAYLNEINRAFNIDAFPHPLIENLDMCDYPVRGVFDKHSLTKDGLFLFLPHKDDKISNASQDIRDAMLANWQGEEFEKDQLKVDVVASYSFLTLRSGKTISTPKHPLFERNLIYINPSELKKPVKVLVKTKDSAVAKELIITNNSFGRSAASSVVLFDHSGGKHIINPNDISELSYAENPHDSDSTIFENARMPLPLKQLIGMFNQIKGTLKKASTPSLFSNYKNTLVIAIGNLKYSGKSDSDILAVCLKQEPVIEIRDSIKDPIQRRLFMEFSKQLALFYLLKWEENQNSGLIESLSIAWDKNEAYNEINNLNFKLVIQKLLLHIKNSILAISFIKNKIVGMSWLSKNFGEISNGHKTMVFHITDNRNIQQKSVSISRQKQFRLSNVILSALGKSNARVKNIKILEVPNAAFEQLDIKKDRDKVIEVKSEPIPIRVGIERIRIGKAKYTNVLQLILPDDLTKADKLMRKMVEAQLMRQLVYTICTDNNFKKQIAKELRLPIRAFNKDNIIAGAIHGGLVSLFMANPEAVGKKHEFGEQQFDKVVQINDKFYSFEHLFDTPEKELQAEALFSKTAFFGELGEGSFSLSEEAKNALNRDDFLIIDEQGNVNADLSIKAAEGINQTVRPEKLRDEKPIALEDSVIDSCQGMVGKSIESYTTRIPDVFVEMEAADAADKEIDLARHVQRLNDIYSATSLRIRGFSDDFGFINTLMLQNDELAKNIKNAKEATLKTGEKIKIVPELSFTSIYQLKKSINSIKKLLNQGINGVKVDGIHINLPDLAAVSDKDTLELNRILKKLNKNKERITFGLAKGLAAWENLISNAGYGIEYTFKFGETIPVEVTGKRNVSIRIEIPKGSKITNAQFQDYMKKAFETRVPFIVLSGHESIGLITDTVKTIITSIRESITPKGRKQKFLEGFYYC